MVNTMQILEQKVVKYIPDYEYNKGKKCGVCSKKIKNRGATNFCITHMGASLKKPINVSCNSCQREIVRCPSTVNKRNYCNSTCAGQGYKLFQSKENHWNWQGGISGATQPLRKSYASYLWRQEVLRLCGKVCCLCKSTENIETDHIKPWSVYPDLRFEISNGRVVCRSCHYGLRKTQVKEIMQIKKERQTKELAEAGLLEIRRKLGK